MGEGMKDCEETHGMIGNRYLQCGKPADILVQPRGRNEGPYWMCEEHAHHNLLNRNCADVTPAEVKRQWPKADIIGYKIRRDFLPEVYALLSRLERQS